MAKFKYKDKRYEAISFSVNAAGEPGYVTFIFHDIGTVTACLAVEQEVIANGYGKTKEEAFFDLMVKYFGDEE